MRTVLKLGEADDGRRLTLEEYEAAEYDPGHKYELIFGRLEVSPLPDVPQEYVEGWVHRKLIAYWASHPEVINYVSPNARVFVEGHDEVSYPEPDVAAYRDFPIADFDTRSWQEITPLLVVEVIDPDALRKDLVRNPEVYILVPSIKEYWVVDTRHGAATPELIVHKRHGRRWRVSTVPFGGVYTTKLLPGFELVVNPRT